jgi:sec-independent protein translocase protein TatA
MTGESMGRIGFWEVIVVLAVIILLFGAKKIPEIAYSLGKAMREFKRATKEAEDDIKDALKDDQKK